MVDDGRTHGDGPAPLVGVRALFVASPGDQPPLRWVRSRGAELRFGDRVVVNDDGRRWVGAVVVTAHQLVEWPEPDGAPDAPSSPFVERPAAPNELPPPTETAGRRLLAALALPESLLRRPS